MWCGFLSAVWGIITSPPAPPPRHRVVTLTFVRGGAGMTCRELFFFLSGRIDAIRLVSWGMDPQGELAGRTKSCEYPKVSKICWIFFSFSLYIFPGPSQPYFFRESFSFFLSFCCTRFFSKYQDVNNICRRNSDVIIQSCCITHSALSWRN